MSGIYNDYLLSSIHQNESSSKYFGYSVFIHSALAIAVAFVSLPAIEKIQNAPVIIEFEAIKEEPVKPAPHPIVVEKNLGIEKIKPTRGAKANFTPAASAPRHAKDDILVKTPVHKSKISKSKIATLKTSTGQGQAHKATYAPSRAGVPETIEDIAAPKLDFDGVVAAQPGKYGEDELENEFKNIDHANEAAIRAQKAQMDKEARLIADQNEQALKSIENDNTQKARAMESALVATRNKNAATLAQAKAAENAALERAAREELQRLNAQKNLAGQGQDGTGIGKGSSGANQSATAQAGSPSGVRRLDQLRQMPGNPLPSYAPEERLRRQQGRLVVQAYVTSEGRLAQFRLLQSTGHDNLDQKSLNALKKWRFYPGQEGWVEIPQTWSLTGDAQEMPTLLRR